MSIEEHAREIIKLTENGTPDEIRRQAEAILDECKTTTMIDNELYDKMNLASHSRCWSVSK